ncbi:AraC family transcriptional regulator [Anaerocolumna sp. MB42-C2]|uniref:AraC family transcriptional regulator n=1 Tax=Anaerocolumna sp. MB42-C2 TaxID=3070997 RepID=UPI0027E1F1A1|nr:AraC family transcriptional regulator [Anaerocolumna sp. MB42-C2]WMJ86697.1 helix-turn-helix transcriptional regulator [Anaerocolumna sp. MB42-C2]
MEEIKHLKSLTSVDAYYEKSFNRGRLGHHFHCNHELILVRNGSAEFIINGAKKIAEANSLVVISDLEEHELSIKEVPYCRYVLNITAELSLLVISEPILLSLLMQRPEKFDHVIPLEQELADKLTVCFDKAVLECAQKKAFWEMRTAMYTAEILLELYRGNSSVFPHKRDKLTVQIVLSLQKDIALDYKNKITLEEMAKKYFISKYYLSRVFKELTGYGFKQYLTLYRLNEAKKLLRNTELPISDVCSGAGYQDINHFIRIFRENQDCSPLQYRKKFKLRKEVL